MRIERALLAVIGIIQIICGASYLARPGAVAATLGAASAAPPWVAFVLATAGARFIGYGIGMLAAAKDPPRYRLWITTMLGIQSVDLVATLIYVANGILPARHILPGAALPLLWVGLLGWVSLRIRTPAHATTRQDVQQQSSGQAES
ncbi:hypothetical protein [Mycobacterium sp. E1747]|uniref:hypothetical protein n=1 Tax=Mycobacterium sp. E1747 TaxID=1834128 RepID=UPI000801F199|nr:hypothetical protein [Mycobacterium sp. E1747]OBH11971.1 hypothetical protein A5695_18085 [Mycobacterium sp. E1747]